MLTSGRSVHSKGVRQMGLSIKNKIILISLLLITTGFLSWYISFSFLKTSLEDLTSLKRVKLKNLLLTQDIQIAFENYVNHSIIALSSNQRDILELNKRDVEEMQSKLTRLYSADASYQNGPIISKLLSAFHKDLTEQINKSNVTLIAKKIPLPNSTLRSLQLIKNNLNGLRIKAENDFTKSAEHMKLTNTRSLGASNSILAGSILLTILFSISLLRSIMNRITRLKRHFTQTHLESIEPILETGNDELGELLKVSNKMLMSIKIARAELVDKYFVENIINTINDLLLVCDDQWNIIKINSQIRNIGLESNIEFFGRNIFDFVKEEDSLKKLSIDEIKKQLSEFGFLVCQAQFFKNQRNIIPVHISAAKMPQTFEYQKQSYVFVIRDLSEHLQHEKEKQALQEQLAHSSKLVSLGTLGAGIAHELNNPLAAILGYAQLLKTHKDLPPKIQDFGDNIIRYGNRMKSIINEFKEFTDDPSENEFQKFSIHLPIEGALGHLKEKLQSQNIKIISLFEDGDDTIEGNYTDIENAFLNIITNSCDSFEKVEDEREKILIFKTSILKDHLILSIEDNAMGIASHKLKHIFDPFFTTKSIGSGTGLGLFVVHQILQKHKCKIELSSEEKSGTCFKIIFKKEVSSDTEDNSLELQTTS